MWAKRDVKNMAGSLIIISLMTWLYSFSRHRRIPTSADLNCIDKSYHHDVAVEVDLFYLLIYLASANFLEKQREERAMQIMC